MEQKQEDISQSQTVVIPLSSLVQNARVYMQDAVSTIMNETNLPPYLMDGIISEVLADIRKQELSELGISGSDNKKEAADG